MTSRPTVSIIAADGKASENSHPLPNVFKAPIRPDIVQYEILCDSDRYECIWSKRLMERAGLSTPAWPRTRDSPTL